MHRKALPVLIAAVLFVTVLIVYTVFSQYVLVWLANRHIDAYGIKLMMNKDEVYGLIGKEEEFEQGFGGYRLKYFEKGISLTLLDDGGTDFFNKVNAIEVTNPEWEIYGFRIGDRIDEAYEFLEKRGFKYKEGFPGYWKKNLYVMIGHTGGNVTKITIGVRDRVASKRIY